MLGYAATRGQTPFFGVVHFLGYFTVLTNIIVAACLTATAIAPRSNFFLNRPSMQTAAAVYIIIVCVVYTLFLRNFRDPDGAQAVADYLLHYVMPALYLIYWALFVRKGTLHYWYAIYWLAYPMAYVACMLVGGAITGRYPYFFFNVVGLGYTRVALNIVGLGAGFLLLGVFAIWIEEMLSKRTN
jgi:hypothetical protein